jgi:hypothetical protein
VLVVVFHDRAALEELEVLHLGRGNMRAAEVVLGGPGSVERAGWSTRFARGRLDASPEGLADPCNGFL